MGPPGRWIARRWSQPRAATWQAATLLGALAGGTVPSEVPPCFAVPLASSPSRSPTSPTDRPTQPCRGGGIGHARGRRGPAGRRGVPRRRPRRDPRRLRPRTQRRVDVTTMAVVAAVLIGAGTPALRGVIAERRARRPGAAETGRRRGPGVARADRGPARAARRPAEAQPARDDPRRARGRSAARAGPRTVSRCRRHHRPATRRPRGGGDRRGVLRTRRPRPPLRPCPARPSRRSRRPHRSRRRPS